LNTGVYAAVLTVTDADFPTAVCRDTTLIYAGLIVDPICGCTASVRWGSAPLEVELFAYEAFVFDPPPYQWSWSFGDGGSGLGRSATHTYAVPGTYYAVATLQTTLNRYQCLPVQRISALEPQVAGVGGARVGGELLLEAPRPNPSRISAAIEFELPRAGRVRLLILEPSGRSVTTLLDEARPAGRHVAVWNGRTDGGHLAPAGLYFASLASEGVTRSVRLVRLP
jgi:hypothetical protein